MGCSSDEFPIPQQLWLLRVGDALWAHVALPTSQNPHTSGKLRVKGRESRGVPLLLRHHNLSKVLRVVAIDVIETFTIIDRRCIPGGLVESVASDAATSALAYWTSPFLKGEDTIGSELQSFARLITYRTRKRG